VFWGNGSNTPVIMNCFPRRSIILPKTSSVPKYFSAVIYLQPRSLVGRGRCLHFPEKWCIENIKERRIGKYHPWLCVLLVSYCYNVACEIGAGDWFQSFYVSLNQWLYQVSCLRAHYAISSALRITSCNAIHFVAALEMLSKLSSSRTKSVIRIHIARLQKDPRYWWPYTFCFWPGSSWRSWGWC